MRLILILSRDATEYLICGIPDKEVSHVSIGIKKAPLRAFLAIHITRMG